MPLLDAGAFALFLPRLTPTHEAWALGLLRRNLSDCLAFSNRLVQLFIH
jgi:hypothetical protein